MQLLTYIKESFKEFRDNVTWATWPELQRDTLLVAVSTFILSVFLYIVDNGFESLLSIVYNLLRTGSF